MLYCRRRKKRREMKKGGSDVKRSSVQSAFALQQRSSSAHLTLVLFFHWVIGWSFTYTTIQLTRPLLCRGLQASCGCDVPLRVL